MIKQGQHWQGDQIWRNFATLAKVNQFWQIFDGSFLFRQNAELTL